MLARSEYVAQPSDRKWDFTGGCPDSSLGSLLGGEIRMMSLRPRELLINVLCVATGVNPNGAGMVEALHALPFRLSKQCFRTTHVDRFELRPVLARQPPSSTLHPSAVAPE